MSTKICTSCGKELPATQEYFHKHSKSKDGLRNKCKECRHIERIRYYNNHKEEAKAYSQLYYILNTSVNTSLRKNKKTVSERVSKLFLEC